MWRYRSDGREHGPVEEAEMRRLIRDGRIDAATPVRPPDAETWRPAADTALADAFAAGAAAAAPSGRDETAAAAAFRPLRPLWTWLRALLIAYVVVSAALAVSSLFQFWVLGRIESGGFADPETLTLAATASDAVVGLTSLAYLVVFLWAGFLFLKLTYRAMRNLWEADAKDVRTSPAWSVGWYFVPFASLWKPLQAVNQIWRNSADFEKPRQAEVPAQIGWWWTLWIVSNVVSWISFRISMGTGMLDPDAAPDIAMYQLVGALDAFTSVVDVPMTLCAMWFWARIVRMQDDRFGLVARF